MWVGGHYLFGSSLTIYKLISIEIKIDNAIKHRDTIIYIRY
jgi:hypothetical protein